MCDAAIMEKLQALLQNLSERQQRGERCVQYLRNLVEVVQCFGDGPFGEELVAVMTDTRHEKKRALRIGTYHFAGYGVIGGSKTMPLESRIYFDFFTERLDDLDNIMWNISRFERTVPDYMLGSISLTVIFGPGVRNSPTGLYTISSSMPLNFNSGCSRTHSGIAKGESSGVSTCIVVPE